MCMPQGGGKRSNGFEKASKPKKHITRVSQREFEKGDPDFVDERITIDEEKKDKGFLSSLFE